MRGKKSGVTNKATLQQQQLYQQQLAKYYEDLRIYQAAHQSPWQKLTPTNKGLAIGIPVAILLIVIIIIILYFLGILSSSAIRATTIPARFNITRAITHKATHIPTHGHTFGTATNIYLYPGGYMTGAITNPDTLCHTVPAPFGVSCIHQFAVLGLDSRNISSLPTVFNFSTTASVSGPNGIPIKTNASGGWASMLGSGGTLTTALVAAGVFGLFTTTEWWSGVDTNGNTITSSNCANFNDNTTGSTGVIGNGGASVTNNGWLINNGTPVPCNYQQNLVCGCTLP